MVLRQFPICEHILQRRSRELVYTLVLFYKSQSIGELAAWLKEINFHSRTCQEVVLLTENRKGNSAGGGNIQEHKHHSPSCAMRERRWFEDAYAEDVRVSLFGCFLR